MNYLGRALFYIDSLIVLLSMLLLAYIKRIKLNYFFRNNIAINVFFAYLIFLIINLFNPTIDYSKNLSIIGMFTIIIPLVYYFKISENREENFFLFVKVIFITISIISITLVVSWLISIDIIRTITELTLIEFRPSVYHSKHTFLMICIGFIIYYVMKKNTFLNFILFFMIVIAAFVSHGKTTIITFLVGLLSFYLVYSLLEKKLTLYKFGISFFIFIIFFILMILFRDDVSSNYTVNAFTSGRFDGWLVYIKLVIEENIIFGYGIDGPKLVNEEGLIPHKHPHNLFIEVLFSLGVLGFITLFYLFICYIKKLFHLDLDSLEYALSVSTFFTIFISAQGFWSVWSDNHVIPILIVLIISLLIDKNKYVIQKD